MCGSLAQHAGALVFDPRNPRDSFGLAVGDFILHHSQVEQLKCLTRPSNIDILMTWNIAQAKQQFSEVVRLSVQEPQAIYNRDKPVAMLVNAELFEAFHQWHTRQHEPTLTEQFSEIRSALHDARQDGLNLPARSTAQRNNSFIEMLEAEGLTTPVSAS